MINALSKRRLLITGGTGSFGETVMQKFLSTDIGEITILSRDEKKQESMRLKYNNQKLRFVLGDIRSYQTLKQSFKGVDYIFHAAALKQVPSCEFYPLEAIKTNILGAENVINAAIDCDVKKVVLLSTDKAVYPINAMGMTKGLMEKLMTAKIRIKAASNTVFCATRYGNVMASRGSVIPLFVRLIKENKALTITDPSMTRFLMTLDESVELVMHAFEKGENGDILVQKSPSTTIKTLALALLKIFNAKNEIKIIGTRHGEKLYESLLSREEILRVKETDKHFIIPIDDRGLDYNSYFAEGSIDLASLSDYTSHNAKRLDLDEVINLLMKVDFIREKLI
tara:strand:- start:566 stop:1582 length:1017 start_codon:yes stop_codon:yes gene_type:complete